MIALNLTQNSLFDPVVNGANNVLPRLPVAFIALLFGFVVIRLVSWIVQILLHFVRLPRGLKGIIVSLLDALLWVFLLVVILQSLNLTSIAILLSGSVAALGLALAGGGSSLASDILAGIFLSRDRDFSVGDEVIAGESQTQGVIESMDMRRIRIRDDKDKLHVIPNSVIERKEWIVVTKRRDRLK